MQNYFSAHQLYNFLFKLCHCLISDILYFFIQEVNIANFNKHRIQQITRPLPQQLSPALESVIMENQRRHKAFVVR